MRKPDSTAIVAFVLFCTLLLGGCSSGGFRSAEIDPPTKGLLHYLQQDRMANVSDRGYKVTAEAASPEVRSGVNTTLKLRVADPSGSPVRSFAEDMTKLLHLIVVSADLSMFMHLHPSYDGDGAFTVTAYFPSGGSYLLISEFIPTGKEPVVHKQWLTVKGEAAKAVKLVPDAFLQRTAGGIEASMSTVPGADALKAGQMAMLQVRFTDATTHEPIQLEPYLGTPGHCVILNDKANQYVHVHAAAEMSSGENIMFHTQFPAGGLYKIWVQVQYKGNVLVFPFVVSVQ